MFFTIEISRPIQWLPGWWRCKGITTFRIWWLFFSVSIHPMRYDEMIELANSGVAVWCGKLTPLAADCDNAPQYAECPSCHATGKPEWFLRNR